MHIICSREIDRGNRLSRAVRETFSRIRALRSGRPVRGRRRSPSGAQFAVFRRVWCVHDPCGAGGFRPVAHSRRTSNRATFPPAGQRDRMGAPRLFFMPTQAQRVAGTASGRVARAVLADNLLPTALFDVPHLTEKSGTPLSTIEAPERGEHSRRARLARRTGQGGSLGNDRQAPWCPFAGVNRRILTHVRPAQAIHGRATISVAQADA